MLYEQLQVLTYNGFIPFQTYSNPLRNSSCKERERKKERERERGKNLLLHLLSDFSESAFLDGLVLLDDNDDNDDDDTLSL